MCEHHIHARSAHGGSKKVPCSLELDYRWLWFAVRVLGTKSGPTARAVSALNSGSISLPPLILSFCI